MGIEKIVLAWFLFCLCSWPSVGVAGSVGQLHVKSPFKIVILPLRDCVGKGGKPHQAAVPREGCPNPDGQWLSLMVLLKIPLLVGRILICLFPSPLWSWPFCTQFWQCCHLPLLCGVLFVITVVYVFGDGVLHCSWLEFYILQDASFVSWCFRYTSLFL